MDATIYNDREQYDPYNLDNYEEKIVVFVYAY